MITFINLTPHAITFRTAGGDFETIEPSGSVARVDTSSKVTGFVAGVPIQSTVLGDVIGLPNDSTEGSFFIVSGMVLEAMKTKGIIRSDVLAPATGPKDDVIRNEKGHVTAVTKFNGLAGF